MCASCGCNQIDDDHGDDRNITMANLNDAAAATDISIADVARNIQQAAGGQAGAGNGQTSAAVQGEAQATGQASR